MLLSESELNLLLSLRLYPRARVQRQSLSDFRSLDKGAGLEFADYRQYVPGDDIRRLDWHHYQKSRRLLVRQYDQYESLSFNLVMDLSDSMACGSSRRIDSVRKICAAYCFLILKHGYKVTIWPVENNVPPRKFSGPAQWLNCLKHIETIPAGGCREITDALSTFSGRSRTAENVIAVSDFICSKGFDYLEKILSQLRQNITCVHMYVESEIDPPWTGDLTLVDSELQTEQTLVMNRRSIDAYKNAYMRYYTDLKRLAAQSGHFYCDVSGESELAEQIHLLAPDGIVYL
jgi:uncharacterized protein (DUF58 family)